MKHINLKRFLMATVVATAVISATSCLRDDDIELLRHPLELRGDFDPKYCVPLGYGQMNINELLNSLNPDYRGLVDESEDVVTVFYHAGGSDTVKGMNFSPIRSIRKPLFTKDEGTWNHHDSILTYDFDIDLFNNTGDVDLGQANISIKDLWMKMDLGTRAYCPDNVRQGLIDYVRVVFDSVRLTYIDHNGVLKNYDIFDTVDMRVDNIVEGGMREDSINLAPIINELPSKISATMRFRVSVNTNLYAGAIDYMSLKQLVDSLNITYLVNTMNVDVLFPFNIKIGDLPYSFDLDITEDLSQSGIDSLIGDVTDGLNIDLKESFFGIRFVNDLPLELTMHAAVLDADSNVLFDLLPLDTIEQARMAPMPNDPLLHESIASSPSTIECLIDADRLAKLAQAKSVHIDLGLRTNDLMVVAKRSDYLQMQAYLKLHPSIKARYKITEKGLLNPKN
ncbi:MAG: hypothetical protein IJ761_05055 [Bacteroidales bacterium]|nr:hypothetical protein [Bacteroidales bacterium]